MKTLFKFVVVAVIMFSATNAFSQEWTKAQKEVWKVVEDSWTAWNAGDVNANMAFIHEKYQGWNAESPLPLDKAAVTKWYTKMKEIGKVESYGINPARIVVIDNAAVVDYFFEFSVSYKEGEETMHESGGGRNVEFYVKDGGKWLLLGDMTVPDDKEEKDD